MNCKILRLWLLIALLFGLPDFVVEGGTQHDVLSKQTCLQQNQKANEGGIESNDGVHRFKMERQQSPMASSVVRVPLPRSVSSSRPTRISHTSGGKSGRFFNHWFGNDSFNLSKFACQQYCRTVLMLRAAAMSPRRYYVIALRHILC